MAPPYENIPFGCVGYPTDRVIRINKIIYEVTGRTLPTLIDHVHNTPSLAYVPPDEGRSEPKAVVLNLREGFEEIQSVKFTIRPATMVVVSKFPVHMHGIQMVEFYVPHDIVDDVNEVSAWAKRWGAVAEAAKKDGKEREEARQRQAEHEARMKRVQVMLLCSPGLTDALSSYTDTCQLVARWWPSASRWVQKRLDTRLLPCTALLCPIGHLYRV